jgi:hypothetical protein
MSLHDDEQFLTAVAAALGETIALVRRHGFHMGRCSDDYDSPPALPQAQRCGDAVDDAVDLSTCGIDWDASDDSRLQRPNRRMTSSRARRRTA